MSRLLLDTTFLVDAERSGGDLDDVIDDDDDVSIAAVTVAELRVGALLADRRHQTARADYVDNPSCADSYPGVLGHLWGEAPLR